MIESERVCDDKKIETIVLNKTQLMNLLPHSGDMCLIESVVQWDKKSISCLAVNHQDGDNPLCHNGVLHVIAGVEYAAQAMAIHGTLKNKDHKKPKMGMLAVLSKIFWTVDRLDQIKGSLDIAATQINELEQGASYRFQLCGNGNQLLFGEAIIALQGY